MKLKQYLFFLLMTMFGIVPLAAQDTPRLVVVPFNPINVSLQEADAVSAAFEAALVRTGSYSVVGRGEITAFLQSRDLGLFDCTSDRCTGDLALALSAAHLVRGNLTSGEGNFVLKVKVVEVTSGRPLYLDTLSARSLEQLRQSMEFFVFKLAGLTVMVGNEERIARELGEVFVETIPARAEIFVNGVRMGISPDLMRRVPLGRVRISAQFGLLYGEKTVDITKSLQQVRLELAEKPGSLQVSGGPNLDAYLDGNRLGPAGGAGFSGLVPGVHALELKGQGLYWQDDVVIKANERAVITAQPRPYGIIQYELPTGAAAEVRGEGIREVVTGYGTLPVPVGGYSAMVSGKNYETVEGVTFSVTKEARTLLRPDLQFSKSYELEQFSRRIEEADRTIGFGYRLTSGDILKLKELRKAIGESRHGFPELVTRAESLIQRAEAIVAAENGAVTPAAVDPTRQDRESSLTELLARKQQLELQMEGRRLQGKRRITGGWVSFGLGLASGGLAGLFSYLSDTAYEAYARSILWEEAQAKQNEVKLWDISTIAALSASGVCLVISSVLWISGPPTRQLRRELEAVEQQIQNLGTEPR